MKRIRLFPRNSSISAFMICIILSASSFDEKRDTTKQELSEVLKISPLNWPASILRGSKTFSTKAMSILNCISDVEVTSAIRTYIWSTHIKSKKKQQRFSSLNLAVIILNNTSVRRYFSNQSWLTGYLCHEFCPNTVTCLVWFCFFYILHPPTVIYVPDWPSLSRSQHIFTLLPYLILFTKILEIVSPVCVLTMEIAWPKTIVFAVSLIFLNVSQFPSLQSLKV